MAEILRREYLTQRVPCWCCSKPLARVTTGTNRGRYVGFVRVLLGLERITHQGCAGRVFDREQEERRESLVVSGRRVERAPRLDEIEDSVR